MEIGKKENRSKENGIFYNEEGCGVEGVEEHIVEKKATIAMKKSWRNIREKLFRNNYKK